MLSIASVANKKEVKDVKECFNMQTLAKEKRVLEIYTQILFSNAFVYNSKTIANHMQVDNSYFLA
jgi:hypothetical protein